MFQATLWGSIAGSAVFIGALIGLHFTIKKFIIALIMSFGTGVLIGAAAFDLLGKAIGIGGLKASAIGFILGSSLFTSFDIIISKKGGHKRKRSSKKKKDSSGLAIFIGTIMDAIPESVMIGISLITEQHISWVLVVAIFISNFPEGLSSTMGLMKEGYSHKKILLLWSSVLILSTLSSILGYLFLANASRQLISAISAFAAGGIIAMVASTMMPEAYEDGGPIVGFITSLGLLSSLILISFE